MIVRCDECDVDEDSGCRRQWQSRIRRAVIDKLLEIVSTALIGTDAVGSCAYDATSTMSMRIAARTPPAWMIVRRDKCIRCR